MQQAMEIVENVGEERKNIILLFLTAILFIIPVVGEVVGTTGIPRHTIGGIRPVIGMSAPRFTTWSTRSRPSTMCGGSGQSGATCRMEGCP